MNHDDHKPDLSTLIDPELEARIVAWVSGEASPFEIAELTRLTNEKPELAIFKRRIEAVRDLAAEAIRPDPEPLRLSPERRAKLLQALGATEDKTIPLASTNAAILPMPAEKKKQRKDWRPLYAIAACLTVGLFTFYSVKNHPSQFEASQTAKFRYDEDRNQEREKAYKAAVSDAKKRNLERETKQQSGSRSRQTTLPVGQLAAEAAASAPQRDGAPILNSHNSLGSLAGSAAGKVLDATTGKYLEGAEVGVQGTDIRVNTDRRGSFAIDKLPSGKQTLVVSYPGLDAKTETVEVSSAKPAEVDVRLSQSVFALEEFRVTGAKKEGMAQAIALQKISVPLKTPLSSAQFGDVSEGPASPAAPLPERLKANGGNYAGLDADKKSKAYAPAPDSEQIQLSPFAVAAANDKGYAAKDFIAAQRLAPNLKNVVSADAFGKIAESNIGEFQKFLPKPSINQPVNSTPNDIEADKADPVPAARPPVEKTGETKFPEVNAAKEPVSTFSLHVSDVSFRLAQAALAKGEEPDAETIRPEEFYNAFSYGDPTPALAEKVSCRVEQAAHPFAQQRNLVRIAVKVAAAGRDTAQPLHLTVLLDTSGSMEREDRAATIQSAVKALTSLLGANDRLTLIGFSRQPRLLAESLSGDQAAQVLDLIKNTPAEGGTNLEEALKLGGELARRQFEAGAQNRIVLLTDGAANLGNANPVQLAASVEALRQSGIAFDACGVGLEGLDDGLLENLTRKGDGRYYVLNSPDAADAGFAKQLAGAFRPAAENVKLQVRFNPARVGRYRLIGFEQHRLNEEDFRNDKVDAAELAAEEAAVAVYQVEALPQGEGELGEVYVRFRDTASGNMVERNWTLTYDAQAPAFDRATPSIQLAGTAALLAEKLRGGESANAINLGDLAPIVNKLRSHYANEPRVQELVTMFEQARKLTGE